MVFQISERVKKTKTKHKQKNPTLPLLHINFGGEDSSTANTSELGDRAGCEMKGSRFPASAPVPPVHSDHMTTASFGVSDKGKTLNCL